MSVGSIYTYTRNADTHSQNTSIQTSQGIVSIGSYGYFLPTEYAAAIGQGFVLTPGIALNALAPISVSTGTSYSANEALLGTDGTVGGPYGSPLSAALASVAYPQSQTPGAVWTVGSSGNSASWQLPSANSSGTIDGGGPTSTSVTIIDGGHP